MHAKISEIIFWVLYTVWFSLCRHLQLKCRKIYQVHLHAVSPVYIMIFEDNYLIVPTGNSLNNLNQRLWLSLTAGFLSFSKCTRKRAMSKMLCETLNIDSECKVFQGVG